MFQTDKTDNLMIKALEGFDLTPNIDNNAFLKLWVSTSQNIHNMNILSSVQLTNHITAEKTIILSNSIK